MDEPVIVPDLAPSVADLAEIIVPVVTDARSARPFLHDEAPRPAWRTEYCLEFEPHVSNGTAYRGIRDTARELKYVEHANGWLELFDLSVDPWELVNVVDDPAYAERRTDLAARLLDVCG